MRQGAFLKRARLSESDKERIVKDRKRGVTVKQLALQYGFSTCLIYKILQQAEAEQK